MPSYGETHPQFPSLYWNGTRWALKRMPNKKSDKCKVKYCRHDVWYEYRNDRGKGRMVTRHICHKCNSLQWRVNNPLEYAFKNLKQSARKRKIKFTLSKDQFRELCDESSYLAFKGSGACDLQIDRIDATKGYEYGNLQVITCSENAAKSNRERYLPEHVQEMKRRKELQEQEDALHALHEEDALLDRLGPVASLVREDYPVIDGVVCPF